MRETFSFTCLIWACAHLGVAGATPHVVLAPVITSSGCLDHSEAINRVKSCQLNEVEVEDEVAVEVEVEFEVELRLRLSLRLRSRLQLRLALRLRLWWRLKLKLSLG